MCLSADTLDRVLGDKRHLVSAELEVRPAEEPCAVAKIEYADCVGEDLLQASREAIESAVHSACLQGKGHTPVSWWLFLFFSHAGVWARILGVPECTVHSALMLHSASELVRVLQTRQCSLCLDFTWILAALLLVTGLCVLLCFILPTQDLCSDPQSRMWQWRCTHWWFTLAPPQLWSLPASHGVCRRYGAPFMLCIKDGHWGQHRRFHRPYVTMGPPRSSTSG